MTSLVPTGVCIVMERPCAKSGSSMCQVRKAACAKYGWKHMPSPNGSMPLVGCWKSPRSNLLGWGGVSSYTVGQRLAYLGNAAVQNGAVGFVTGCTGSAAVYAVRSLWKPAAPPPPEHSVRPVIRTGLGWLYFLSIHYNLRYNLVNAAEDMLYAR